MKIKRISLRFNLDNEDDRRAWDALHRLDAQSLNKEIIARINEKELTHVLKDCIRQAVSEEFSKAAKDGAVRLISQDENNAEEIAEVFNFLDSF